MKPEWGQRRTCKKCQTAFFDMRKDPMVCPKCNTTYKAADFSAKANKDLNNDIPDSEEDARRSNFVRFAAAVTPDARAAAGREEGDTAESDEESKDYLIDRAYPEKEWLDQSA